jgi:biopolymer transport protein ExbD
MNFRGRGGGGLRNRKSNLIDSAAVDLTPLIDVTFQLLIFFLLTATFNNDAAFKVKLPKATANDPATETKAIVVEISEDGRFEVDKKIVDEAELQTRLCMAAKESRSQHRQHQGRPEHQAREGRAGDGRRQGLRHREARHPPPPLKRRVSRQTRRGPCYAVAPAPRGASLVRP